MHIIHGHKPVLVIAISWLLFTLMPTEPVAIAADLTKVGASSEEASIDKLQRQIDEFQRKNLSKD